MQKHLALASLFATSAFVLAQAPAQTLRTAYVTVSDPLNRFVSGLDRDVFEIVGNGVHGPVKEVADSESSISVVVVTDDPSTPLPGDAIRSESVADALRRLSATQTARKVLIIAPAVDPQNVPAGIAVIKARPENFSRAIVEARNQYLLRFESPNNAAAIEVIVHQPRGLPELRAWVK